MTRYGLVILVVIGAVLIGCASDSVPPTQVPTDTPTPNAGISHGDAMAVSNS